MQKFIYILYLVIIFILCGCSAKDYSDYYEIGLMYTTEYKDKSELILLDTQMRELSKIEWNYSSMGYDGFCNSLIVDKTLYLLPKGHGDRLDYGKVVAYHLEDGSKEEYDFERVNITGTACDGKELYIFGNLNEVGYIDKCNIQTGEIERAEFEQIFAQTLCIVDGRVFAIASDFETGRVFLGEFILQEGNYHVLHELDKEEPSYFLQEYERTLYYVQDNILYEYSIENEQAAEFYLQHENAFNLQLNGTKLYIGCTDLWDEKESFVDIFNLEDKKFEKYFKVEGSILQMEIPQNQEKDLYILSYNTLTRYDISKEDLIVDAQIDLMEKEDFYIGGFYLNEK